MKNNKLIQLNNPPRPINANLSGMLDCARWIAAMMVMTGHLRDILFVNYHDVIHPNIIIRFFFFFTGFGHHAVIIFFVISGFLVGGDAIEQFMFRTFCWRNYVIKRTSRIYIVFFFALVIGGLLDLSGLYFFNQLGMYNNTDTFQFNSELTDRDISKNLSLEILIGNIAMLQTIKVPVLGSNGPLWSLANEFWYYLLFPALIGVFSSSKLWKKLLSFGLALVICILLPAKILLYFTIWVLGSCIRTISCSQFPNTFFSLLLFIISLVLIRAFGKDSFWLDFLIAATFSLVLHSFHHHNNQPTQNPLLRLKIHNFFADFSYSLYVIHFPLILFLVNVLHSLTGLELDRQPDIMSFSIFISLMFTIYCIVFFTAQITEKKTKSARKYLFSFSDSLFKLLTSSLKSK